ncbi:hypothetical protein RFI_08278 [Reticulomyxa filosa]|uniref:Uncharacterized protein n=1 Tax=Reticulomyxa filosa TaxID=46433 RepID=X6NRB8_RETFI|nr:hypothetical protein RFI_08278 [Reticulomyxa filosa]|eukprot:ETO28845.1 hypothetical protein RFI_08278 [Reticulomyxa filosa]
MAEYSSAIIDYNAAEIERKKKQVIEEEEKKTATTTTIEIPKPQEESEVDQEEEEEEEQLEKESENQPLPQSEEEENQEELKNSEEKDVEMKEAKRPKQKQQQSNQTLEKEQALSNENKDVEMSDAKKLENVAEKDIRESIEAFPDEDPNKLLDYLYSKTDSTITKENINKVRQSLNNVVTSSNVTSGNTTQNYYITNSMINSDTNAFSQNLSNLIAKPDLTNTQKISEINNAITENYTDGGGSGGASSEEAVIQNIVLLQKAKEQLASETKVQISELAKSLEQETGRTEDIKRSIGEMKEIIQEVKDSQKRIENENKKSLQELQNSLKNELETKIDEKQIQKEAEEIKVDVQVKEINEKIEKLAKTIESMKNEEADEGDYLIGLTDILDEIRDTNAGKMTEEQRTKLKRFESNILATIKTAIRNASNSVINLNSKSTVEEVIAESEKLSTLLQKLSEVQGKYGISIKTLERIQKSMNTTLGLAIASPLREASNSIMYDRSKSSEVKIEELKKIYQDLMINISKVPAMFRNNDLTSAEFSIRVYIETLIRKVEQAQKEKIDVEMKELRSNLSKREGAAYEKMPATLVRPEGLGFLEDLKYYASAGNVKFYTQEEARRNIIEKVNVMKGKTSMEEKLKDMSTIVSEILENRRFFTEQEATSTITLIQEAIKTDEERVERSETVANKRFTKALEELKSQAVASKYISQLDNELEGKTDEQKLQILIKKSTELGEGITKGEKSVRIKLRELINHRQRIINKALGNKIAMENQTNLMNAIASNNKEEIKKALIQTKESYTKRQQQQSVTDAETIVFTNHYFLLSTMENSNTENFAPAQLAPPPPPPPPPVTQAPVTEEQKQVEEKKIEEQKAIEENVKAHPIVETNQITQTTKTYDVITGDNSEPIDPNQAQIEEIREITNKAENTPIEELAKTKEQMEIVAFVKREDISVTEKLSAISKYLEFHARDILRNPLGYSADGIKDELVFTAALQGLAREMFNQSSERIIRPNENVSKKGKFNNTNKKLIDDSMKNSDDFGIDQRKILLKKKFIQPMSNHIELGMDENEYKKELDSYHGSNRIIRALDSAHANVNYYTSRNVNPTVLRRTDIYYKNGMDMDSSRFLYDLATKSFALEKKISTDDPEDDKKNNKELKSLQIEYRAFLRELKIMTDLGNIPAYKPEVLTLYRGLFMDSVPNFKEMNKEAYELSKSDDLSVESLEMLQTNNTDIANRIKNYIQFAGAVILQKAKYNATNDPALLRYIDSQFTGLTNHQVFRDGENSGDYSYSNDFIGFQLKTLAKDYFSKFMVIKDNEAREKWFLDYFTQREMFLLMKPHLRGIGEPEFHAMRMVILSASSGKKIEPVSKPLSKPSKPKKRRGKEVWEGDFEEEVARQSELTLPDVGTITQEEKTRRLEEEPGPAEILANIKAAKRSRTQLRPKKNIEIQKQIKAILAPAVETNKNYHYQKKRN